MKYMPKDNKQLMLNLPFSDDLFNKVLQNQQDITDTFDRDMGGIPKDLSEASTATTPHLQLMRTLMEKHRISPNDDFSHVEYGLIDILEWAKADDGNMKKCLESGDVAAVDGTPILPPQRYLTAQIYACAVGYITNRTPLNLTANVTKTKATAEYTGKIDDLLQFIKESEKIPGGSSWANAFREYKERELALTCPVPYVIIDGPVITQNLFTRRQGRDLLTKLYKNNTKEYYGVIKDIRDSDAETRFAARALKQNEAYISHTLFFQLKDRMLKDYQGSVSKFLTSIGQDILRGVFKVGQKAFGFQCHRKHFKNMISVLFWGQNEQPGYEIPFLQVQIDAQIRGLYRPAEIKTAIESIIAEGGDDAFFDELDERDER